MNNNKKTDAENEYFTYERGFQATEKLLKNKSISAIFCADNTIAFGCSDFVKDKTNLKIHNQIKTIGYDDIINDKLEVV